MKQETLEMLLRNLKSTGHYHNNGKGILYRYFPEQGVWLAQDGISGRRYLATDTQAVKPDLRVRELDVLYSELCEDIRFTEDKLAEEGCTPLIAVNNGVVNLETGELLKHDPQFFLRNALDFKYSKDAANLPPENAWQKFGQTSLGIKGDVMADATGQWKSFTEAFIYALSRLPNNKKMIILLGPANSGKSAILEVMERLVGESAWVPMSFSDMCTRFRGSLMERMQLLTCDEMPNAPLRKLDVIKRIIGGDPVLIEGKGVNAKKYRPCSKIVFATNNLPTLGEPDVGGGFAERLHIIPFSKRSNATDPNLVENLWSDRDVFLSVAVHTMPEFIKRGYSFSQDNTSARLLAEFKSNAFSLETFLNDCCYHSANNRLPLSVFYEKYVDFCKDNLSTAIPRTELKAALTQLGYVCKRMRVTDAGYPNAVQCVLDLALQGAISGNAADIAPDKPAHVVISRKDS